MAIPNQALVLVTDGRKLLFLRNHGDENQIDLRTEAHDEREDRKDHEIKTDAAGSQGQRWGDARPAMDETDFHQQAEDRWVKDAAARLKERALRNDFEALAISPRRKRSACFARNCTRRSSAGSSPPSTR